MGPVVIISSCISFLYCLRKNVYAIGPIITTHCIINPLSYCTSVMHQYTQQSEGTLSVTLGFPARVHQTFLVALKIKEMEPWSEVTPQACHRHWSDSEGKHMLLDNVVLFARDCSSYICCLEISRHNLRLKFLRGT